MGRKVYIYRFEHEVPGGAVRLAWPTGSGWWRFREVPGEELSGLEERGQVLVVYRWDPARPRQGCPTWFQHGLRVHGVFEGVSPGTEAFTRVVEGEHVAICDPAWPRGSWRRPRGRRPVNPRFVGLLRQLEQ